MHKTPLEQVERAALLYRTNKDASAALGIAKQSFVRICRRHHIATPSARRQNRRTALRG